MPFKSRSSDSAPAGETNCRTSQCLIGIAFIVMVFLFFLWRKMPSDFDSSITEGKTLTIHSQDQGNISPYLTEKTPSSLRISLPPIPTNTSLEAFLTLPSNETSLSALLNGFDLQPREQFIESSPLRITSEYLICPWNPSSYLLLLKIETIKNQLDTFHATLDFPLRANQSATLLGQAPSPAPTILTALSLSPNQTLSYLIQITTVGNEKPQTHIAIQRGDTPPQQWLLSPREQHEPSSHARFSALLAAFYLWKQSSPALNASQLRALSHECLTLKQNPAHTQAIQTILKQLPPN